MQDPIATPGPRSLDPKAPILLSIEVLDILVIEVDEKVAELVGIKEWSTVVTDIVIGPVIIAAPEYSPVAASALRCNI